MNKKKARKARRSRGWIPLLLVFALLAGGFAALMNRALPLAAGTIVEVQPGEPLGTALRRFQTQGQIDASQRLALLVWARLSGAAVSVRAGEYRVEPGTTTFGLLQTLRSGKVVLHEVRFIEGWRFAQALQALRQNPDVQHTIDDGDPAAIMRAVGAPGGTAPEGRFFPDTYRFAKSTSDVTILKQAYQAMNQRLTSAWAARAADLPYTDPQQALTMASLIEKETAVESERPEIAGVFVRRLRLGMRLQTDPAVIYGLGERYDGNLHLRDLQADTPYNTYTRTGLPPTPICLPSEAALVAALHPAGGDALYFVARGDGTHQFSDTLEAHNAAVQHYQLHR